MALVLHFEITGDDGDPDEEAALRRAFHSWIAEIFRDSQMRCPVVTGNLLRSGHVEGEANWRKIIYDADYAEIVEDGRGLPGEKYYFPGRHFLENAVGANAHRFDQLFVQALHQFFDVRED